MKDEISTFSIVGFDSKTQELGVAVQSKYFAVGSVVPWAKAGVGAIATQALGNTSYGPSGLSLLEEGKSPEEVAKILTDHDPEKQSRQVGIVDINGDAYNFTGEKCSKWAGGIAGKDFSAQGNILVSEETVKAMAIAFQESKGPLSRRLVKSLFAGQKAGGDRRGRQSACLLVVKEKGGYRGFNDRYIDIRVDDHKRPIEELNRLLNLFYLYFGDMEEEFLKIEGPLIGELKRILRRLGYYKRNVESGDRVFDEDLKNALLNFYYKENFGLRKEREGFIDKKVLEYIRNLYKT